MLARFGTNAASVYITISCDEWAAEGWAGPGPQMAGQIAWVRRPPFLAQKQFGNAGKPGGEREVAYRQDAAVSEALDGHDTPVGVERFPSLPGSWFYVGANDRWSLRSQPVIRGSFADDSRRSAGLDNPDRSGRRRSAGSRLLLGIRCLASATGRCGFARRVSYVGVSLVGYSKPSSTSKAGSTAAAGTSISSTAGQVMA